MIKKQLYKTLLTTFTLITLIYGFILIPFENQRLRNVEQKIELLLNTTMEQRIAEIGNMLFLKNEVGLKTITQRIKMLNGIETVDTFLADGAFLTTTDKMADLKLNLDPENFPEDYSFKVKGEGVNKVGEFIKSISVVGERYGFVRIIYSLNDAAAEASKSIAIFAALLISILLASAVIPAYFISRKVVIPLTSLVNAMQEMEQGKLGAQVRVRGNNEISSITEAFNRMSAENARMYKELEIVNFTLERKVEERTYQLEQKNEELSKLAVKDELTQLANRRGFEQMFEHEWFSAQRSRQPLSLIVCDIDYFKNYNDTYGHQAGDECLKKIAEIFHKHTSRTTDIPARYGGEEFAIILPHTPLEGAVHVAEQIREDVIEARIPHRASEISDYVTISLGAASTVPAKGEWKESLFEKADRALYTSKKLGRNRITPYEGEIKCSEVPYAGEDR